MNRVAIMTEPSSTFSAGKLLFTGAGAGLAYAAAVVSDIPLPTPTMHNTFEAVMAALVAYLVKEARTAKKEPGESGHDRNNWREMLMQKLEDMAYNSKDTASELKEHRIEFSGFKADTMSRFQAINDRFGRFERSNTGEVKRPS